MLAEPVQGDDGRLLGADWRQRGVFERYAMWDVLCACGSDEMCQGNCERTSIVHEP